MSPPVGTKLYCASKHDTHDLKLSNKYRNSLISTKNMVSKCSRLLSNAYLAEGLGVEHSRRRSESITQQVISLALFALGLGVGVGRGAATRAGIGRIIRVVVGVTARVLATTRVTQALHVLPLALVRLGGRERHASECGGGLRRLAKVALRPRRLLLARGLLTELALNGGQFALDLELLVALLD